MPIYIKDSTTGISTIIIEDLYLRLTASARSSEIDPYAVAYSSEHEAHFLFTIQHNELRRFALRRLEVTHMFSKITGYLPVPAYCRYCTESKLFLPTPLEGRFTESGDFLVNEGVLLTPAEIDEHCIKTQIIVVESAAAFQCPYLPHTALTEKQQRILYFNNVIKSCDKFYLTLQIIADTFDDPEKIIGAVMMEDHKLLQLNLTHDEKKYIEMYFLPFFLPEYINKIADMQDVTIGEIVDFYVHCIESQSKKTIPHQKQLSEKIRQVKVGELSADFASDGVFWQYSRSTEPGASKHENEAIFNFLSVVMGINTRTADDFKILVRQQINCREISSHLHAVVIAINDYLETLTDENKALHFSPQYQEAYNDLSVAFPIPENDNIKKNIVRNLCHAKKIIEYHQITLFSLDALFENMQSTSLIFSYHVQNEIKSFFLMHQCKWLPSLTKDNLMQLILSDCTRDHVDLFITLIADNMEINCLRSIFNDEGITIRIKMVFLSALSDDRSKSLLNELAQFDQQVLLTLMTEYSYKLRHRVRLLEPPLLINLIKTIKDAVTVLNCIALGFNTEIVDLLLCRLGEVINNASDFKEICQHITCEDTGKVYQQLIRVGKNPVGMVCTASDFELICSCLKDSDKEKFINESFAQLPSKINSADDLSSAFRYISLTQRDALLENIKPRLASQLINNVSQLNIVLHLLSEKQLLTCMDIILEKMRNLKTLSDFNSVFLQDCIFSREIRLILYKGLIETANSNGLNILGASLFYVAQSKPADTIVLLSALCCIRAVYSGVHEFEFGDFLMVVRGGVEPTVESMLAQIKLSDFCQSNRTGRLHAALVMLINVFEKKEKIDIEAICAAAIQKQFFGFSCCS